MRTLTAAPVLAATGVTIPLIVPIVAGAIVLIGAAILIVVAIRRRRRV